MRFGRHSTKMQHPCCTELFSNAESPQKIRMLETSVENSRAHLASCAPSCTNEQQITQTAVETSRIPLPVGTSLSMALETERSAALDCMPELILLKLFCQVLKLKCWCQLYPHRVSRMSPHSSALRICVCYTLGESLRLAEHYVLSLV